MTRQGVGRWIAAGLTALSFLVTSAAVQVPGGTPAYADGSTAIRTPDGWDANALPRWTAAISQRVPLPFSVGFFTSAYTQAYVNTNGTVSFRAANAVTDPVATLDRKTRDDIFAVFWANVSTANPASGVVRYSSAASPPLVDGRPAFIVTWDGVGYHDGRADALNRFQLVLVDRSDTGAGNYDIEFNYGQVLWDLPTDPVASTVAARSGLAQRSPGLGFELPGSGIAGSRLDTGGQSLIGHCQGTDTLGRYVWQVRSRYFGVPPTVMPAFTGKILEGNANSAEPGFSGYDGSEDAVATAAAGTTITALTRTPPAGSFLPLGETVVTWTATDSTGRSTQAMQTITVADTTPPTGPTSLTSTTHSPGTWSGMQTVAVQWSSDATDTCTGVEGYLAGWSSGGPGEPSIPLAASDASATAPLADGTWYFSLRTLDAAGNLSSATDLGPFLVDATAPSTSDNVPAGWFTGESFGLVLDASDPTPGSGVASTSYRLDGGAPNAYAGTVAITSDGIHGIEYASEDAAGNREDSRTATLRKDSSPPTVPTDVAVSVNSTDSVTVSWAGSSDTVSGLASYAVYRDGTEVATLPPGVLEYRDEPLVPGDTHDWQVRASDLAGNASALSVADRVTVPSTPIWITLDANAVDMGTVPPDTVTPKADATVARVGGLGGLTYTLTCSGGISVPRIQTRRAPCFHRDPCRS